MNDLLRDATPPWALAAGALAGLLLALLAGRVRRRWARRAERALLSPFATLRGQLPIYLRGLFVPGSEYFSRAPEDPRHPAGGVTVHKWPRIAEVHAAADVQAAGTLLRFLAATCPALEPVLLAGDAGRPAWGEHGIVVGPHYLAYQVLDGCTPRLATVRQPAAFRLLRSGTVFEAREGLDYGLVYKGVRSGTRRSFLLVSGLDDTGTLAAAAYLVQHAALLGRLLGAGPFALIVAVHPGRGAASATLQGLEPRPAWWRRLLYHREWRALRGAMGASPPAPPRRPSGALSSPQAATRSGETRAAPPAGVADPPRGVAVQAPIGD